MVNGINDLKFNDYNIGGLGNSELTRPLETAIETFTSSSDFRDVLSTNYHESAIHMPFEREWSDLATRTQDLYESNRSSLYSKIPDHSGELPFFHSRP